MRRARLKQDKPSWGAPKIRERLRPTRFELVTSAFGGQRYLRRRGAISLFP
jgi:hypothetical protein